VHAIRIAAAADARLADYRAVAAHATDGRARLLVAEGRLLVRRLLAAPRFATRSVLTTPSALAGLEDLLALHPDVPVYLGTAAVMREMLGYRFARGCLALGVARTPLTPDALLAACMPRLIVALDRVSNPDNVGGVFRNARALGADAVLLSPGCCDPLYRKALRVSMGGALELPFAWAPEWPAELGLLRGAGFAVVALTPEGDVELPALAPERYARLVLVVGSEAAGVGEPVLRTADARVRIAMAAGVDSLNVAAATAIALHRLGPKA